MQLLNYVPHFVRDEAHRIYVLRGLCQDTFQLVRSLRLQTSYASKEQALYMERGAAVPLDRDLPPGASSGEKRPVLDNGGQISRQRSSRFLPRVVDFRGPEFGWTPAVVSASAVA